jgi:hypothetical protein
MWSVRTTSRPRRGLVHQRLQLADGRQTPAAAALGRRYRPGNGHLACHLPSRLRDGVLNGSCRDLIARWRSDIGGRAGAHATDVIEGRRLVDAVHGHPNQVTCEHCGGVSGRRGRCPQAAAYDHVAVRQSRCRRGRQGERRAERRCETRFIVNGYEQETAWSSMSLCHQSPVTLSTTTPATAVE